MEPLNSKQQTTTHLPLRDPEVAPYEPRALVRHQHRDGKIKSVAEVVFDLAFAAGRRAESQPTLMDDSRGLFLVLFEFACSFDHHYQLAPEMSEHYLEAIDAFAALVLSEDLVGAATFLQQMALHGYEGVKHAATCTGGLPS
ncbi:MULTISPECIES: hypothetical protein [Herbaspirillum]|jgi:hypothetical protein|uniref:Uncharacterized protein n=2 Tax=Herbaspirillum huttiense TaxID=863372 RepID=A0AAJ2H5B9_9BURK|nr:MULTISPECIES: hypothetical protein [Herbaspirillum]MDR9837067.1 hypothetical protein [Herbaspirillum huttiense]